MEETTMKKNQVPMDRIYLQGDAKDRIQRWADDLNTQFKGLRISKTDLVSYLIMSHDESLSADEAQDIRDTFFDQVRFASWILKELKEAQKRGETASIEDLLTTVVSNPKRTPRRKKSGKPDEVPSLEPPQNEVGSSPDKEGGEMI